ncbi:hypothetical protein LEMLEM_LOCUS16283, partial [Lemmus lemmus]
AEYGLVEDKTRHRRTGLRSRHVAGSFWKGYQSRASSFLLINAFSTQRFFSAAILASRTPSASPTFLTCVGLQAPQEILNREV